MITESELKKQINRLRKLPRQEEQTWGTPEEPGLGAELLRILWRVCTSDTHAGLIVDELIEKHTFCPTPADMLRASQAVRCPGAEEPRHEVPDWMNNPKPQVCRECKGWGTVGVRPHVRYCACSDGEWLAENLPDTLRLANAMPPEKEKFSNAPFPTFQPSEKDRKELEKESWFQQLKAIGGVQ